MASYDLTDGLACRIDGLLRGWVIVVSWYRMSTALDCFTLTLLYTVDCGVVGDHRSWLLRVSKICECVAGSNRSLSVDEKASVFGL